MNKSNNDLKSELFNNIKTEFRKNLSDDAGIPTALSTILPDLMMKDDFTSESILIAINTNKASNHDANS